MPLHFNFPEESHFSHIFRIIYLSSLSKFLFLLLRYVELAKLDISREHIFECVIILIEKDTVLPLFLENLLYSV